MVRPWNAPSAATTVGRPVRRAILKAASFASAPLLAKNTRPSRPVNASSRSARRSDGSLATRFEVWPRVATCRLTAATTAGCA
jgi:hypothetical protein